LKRRLIYFLPMLLIVLGICLFINRQKSKNILENPEQKIISANTTENKEMPIITTVNIEQSKVRYLAPIFDVNVQRDIVHASKKNEVETEESLKFDLYEPANDNNMMRPVFIFIHGGGYSVGSKSDATAISMELAKRGYVVLSMDYRLKKDPFVNFPQTLSDVYEDIFDVIGWINNNAVSYGLDAGHLAIGGDSAGGQLSMNFVNEYLVRDPSIVKSIFAVVDIYGGLPLNRVHENFPPVMIIHGTIDQLIPYRQSLELRDTLQNQGIYHNLLTMEGVGHDYKNPKYFDEVVDWTSHFLWNVISRPGTEWLPEKAGITAISGDQFDIKLPESYMASPTRGQLKVALPEGWSLDKNEGDQTLRVKVPVGWNRGNYSVFVTLNQDQEAVPGFVINVNVVEPLKVSFETYFDSTDHKIKTHMQMTNRSKSNFSGSLQVTYNTELVTVGTFTTSVDQLEPGKSVTFNIPELARGIRTLSGFNTSGTLVQKTVDTFNALLIHKLQKPIHIDGNLEEWKDQVRFDVNAVKVDNWKGTEDASAVGYLSWDVNNLHLAVEVTDDRHAQQAENSAIWNGDSVQLAIGIANADGSVPLEYHELGVAMDDKGHLSKWRWGAPKDFSTDGSVEVDYTISRKNQKTIYEIAIPWSELTKDTLLVKQGMKIKFSMLVNDNDGDGRKGWLEFNSGIGSGKDINEFGDLYLAD
jgi:acetyl esterase/lipase